MNGWRSSFHPAAIILAALLAGGFLRAQEETYPTGPAAGQDLAAALRSMRPLEDTNWQGVLKISGGGHKTITVPVTCRTVTGESTWSVTYTVAATNSTVAEKLEIIFSTNAPPQYLYACATAPGAAPGELKPLTGAEADVPLGGSDFWLSDLGFEFYHWPDQNRLKGEMRRGKPCYVLESGNPHPGPGGYSRVKVWIEKESGAPLQAETYGTDGNVFKEFELGSVKKVNGRYELKDLEIINDRTGSRTRLVFDLGAK
jgi:outer membrane lipoprotein-sorting protein